MISFRVFDLQVFNTRQANRDLEALGNLGIFSEPLFFRPVSEESTMEYPVYDLNIQLREHPRVNYLGGLGVSEQVNESCRGKL